ncbi:MULTISPECIES: glycosyltransferase family 4 protein [Streptomyces]|uniref:glycosyltransferase family 4 protein n=1 Tax=Streptomyces TaxID=1883 RepID=UPI001884E979|nr:MULTISPECIES: glycosyltransferase family 4 protein [Streptomyces]MBF8175891.1 glycosyltransferase family 4 protein [Streptomyces olivaceus]MBZ6138431.1 glycosyltransferase family 4 protein [Streptomyces olivaceus]MBZ6166676.1 glycosyltransferase family 4 protein [Streptomyces olivaceus]MBZ6177365.1 glycosyltransferase family 4 protein [Streptomyces olivaceus]MBZ6184337.1 glycosyltransferase family 4 protein [Streptomyces olivaceus]
MTPVSSHAPHGQSPLRTVQVLGGGNAGSSAHVRSLAAGLVARGVKVTVCAPDEAERTYDFTGAGADHVHVPRSSDPVSVAALRAVCADADIVHAHGLHASFRAALALGGRRVRTPLVVTWHEPVHAEGARAALLRVLERRVMKAATVVLGATSELVDEARRTGARDARLGPVALPTRTAGPAGPEDPDGPRPKLRAELGAVDRPLLVAVGSLERHRAYDVLLDAAHTWRRLDPAPLVVVAGEGSLRGELQARIEAEELPVALVGSRDDVPELLAAADLALLPGRGETGRSVLVQEALHARVPLVAAGADGIPELVGDAAELVPPGDAGALADAVVRLLGDAGRQDELRDRGLRQAAAWPTEDETVAQVLSVYDELTQPTPLL